MKATVVECLMGVFGFGEKNELVDYVLFPKDSVEIVERLEKIEVNNVIEEMVVLMEKLQEKGFTVFVFESSKMAQNAREKLNIEVDTEKPAEAGELLRRNLEKFAVDSGFVKRREQLRGWIHKVSMELTKARVRKAGEKRDLLVVQAIQTVDDLDKSLNLFMSRIREWYGLHFPELDRLIDKHETYARLIINLGRRADFTAENLEKEGLPKDRAKKIVRIADSSMGANLIEGDLDQIQGMCRSTLELYDARQALEKYVDSVMDEVAPNTRALVGSLLGARLIALAGGLINLAKLPASTVQVLGAEKALFRSLRTGARPPKHGIFFQHSLIHGAKRWQRGKIARALAGKLVIAARIDAFSGNYVGEKLKNDLEKRVEEIKEKYDAPPPMKRTAKKRPRRTKRGRRR
ncbi:MAG: C/D box methylation guide ribonucleoprotein complex aNOP56 subunit [Candidatus Bathyarchaeota archaeon]|nr:MAG: C/D box methylation guide ribonucleoprotein complex aNOP56 subunit [Candidatus Bathyarchaeota archaeon]